MTPPKKRLKSPKDPLVPEKVIQAGILEYLRLNPDLAVWRMPNGGVRQTIRGKTIFTRSPVKGFPDIFGCLKPSGRLFAFEVKAKDGRLSDEQMATLARLKSCGALVAVVRSLQEVVDILKAVL